MILPLETQIRDAVRAQGIDPSRDRGSLLEIIDSTLDNWAYNSGRGMVPAINDEAQTRHDLINTFAGYGQLQELFDDPDVEEIWINSGSRIFCSKSGVTELTTIIMDDAEIHELVEKMLRSSGRRIDYSSPFVDAALPGGERLHVVIPPITSSNWAVNIRKHTAATRKLKDLVSDGMLSDQAAEFLRAAVISGLNIVVSGATQAGKTTFVRALCGVIPANKRVITCEEVFELSLKQRDVVAMQTRPPSLEGKGEVDLRRLVREALRMRPEYFIVGECRGSEALDMLIGLNSGVPGMTTIHANSAREALTKLCTLPLLAGENVTAQFVVPTVAQATDLVIQLTRGSSGKRWVEEIVAVSGRVEESQIESTRLFVRSGDTLVRADGTLEAEERFSAAGFNLNELLAGGE